MTVREYARSCLNYFTLNIFMCKIFQMSYVIWRYWILASDISTLPERYTYLRNRGLKDRQYNGQKKMDKKDKQRNTKHYTGNCRSSNSSPIKWRGELMCSGRVSSSCSTYDTRRVTVKRHKHDLYKRMGGIKCKKIPVCE